MKPTVLLSISTLLLAGSVSAAFAQERIYRCGGKEGAAPEYINNAKEAQSRGCRQIEGGNVTVVQSLPQSRPAVRVAAAAQASPAASNEAQRARDSLSLIHI